MQKSLILVLIFSLFSCAPAAKISPRHASDSAKVLKVTDGDTLQVEYSGKKESIRLIGIDTPESKANLKAQRDAKRSHDDIKTITQLGQKAWRFVQSKVKPGDKVALEFDVEPRDRYRRLLAYVYLKDGTMLNELIVQQGYANLMTYPPNVKHVERFKTAYKDARQNQRGLWSK